MLVRLFVCSWRSHLWRQTVRGWTLKEPRRTLYGRQCRRCLTAEPCPCLGCVRADEYDHNLAEPQYPDGDSG